MRHVRVYYEYYESLNSLANRLMALPMLRVDACATVDMCSMTAEIALLHYRKKFMELWQLENYALNFPMGNSGGIHAIE